MPLKFFASLLSFFLICCTSVAVRAQQQIFVLESATVAEEYELDIEETLRDKYEQELQSKSASPDFQWSLASGELPPGLNLMADGRIVGTPQIARKRPYIFRVNVADASLPTPRSLMLAFSLSIIPAQDGDTQIRLERVGVPRLTSTTDSSTNSESTSETTDNSQGRAAGARPSRTTPRQTPKAADVIITAADVLPSGESEAQVTITVKNPAITSLLILEPQSDYLKKVEPIPATKIIAEKIKLSSPKSTIRVLAFKSDGTKIEPDATKDILASNAKPKEAEVFLGEPFRVENEPEFPLSVKLNDSKNILTQLYFKVLDPTGKVVDEGTHLVEKDSKAKNATIPMQQVLMRIGPGVNKISVAGYKNDGTKVDEATTSIECAGTCGGMSPNTPRVVLEEPFRVTDQIDTPIVVSRKDDKKDVKKYYYVVRNEDKIIDENEVDAALDATRNPTPQKIIVRLREGRNTVSVFGTDASDERKKLTDTATTFVTCLNCAGASSMRTGSSVFTRAILGFEQSGGSSADSVQKPFLDFFFGAPIGGKNTDVVPPLFSIWGNIRFASVPQQGVTGAALQNFASNFSTTFEALNVSQLVQGFDFLTGVDIRILPPSKKGYLNLIPGTKQRTSVSFMLGGGAISPLNRQQSPPQIFAIPKLANGNIDPDFLKLFPEAAGKTNVAFVTPDRDRFFRQFYAGLRFKTFFYDKHDSLINRFPAILDLGIGQNEIVTGNLRNAVVRIEGFYPFPFKAASFLYLYGTAMLKVGDRGVRTNLPLFLNPPTTTVSLPNPNTFIVPIDRNPNLRTNRDYYRFGFGINLIELLDKLRPAPAP